MSWVIGIAGASASGKTSVTSKIAEEASKIIESIYDNQYSTEVTVLHQDDYFFTHDGIVTYDSLDSVDNALLIEHIKNWKKGNPVEPNKIKLLLVEGFLLCATEELYSVLNWCIFLHVQEHTCKLRRFERDVWLRENENYFPVIWYYFKKFHEHIISSIAALPEDFVYYFQDDHASPTFMINAELPFVNVYETVVTIFSKFLKENDVEHFSQYKIN